MHLAAQEGNRAIFERVWNVSKSADRQKKAFVIALGCGHVEIVRFIVEQRNEYLSQQHDIACLQQAIIRIDEHRVYICQACYPLTVATAYGRREVVTFLINKGAIHDFEVLSVVMRSTNDELRRYLFTMLGKLLENYVLTAYQTNQDVVKELITKLPKGHKELAMRILGDHHRI